MILVHFEDVISILTRFWGYTIMVQNSTRKAREIWRLYFTLHNVGARLWEMAQAVCLMGNGVCCDNFGIEGAMRFFFFGKLEQDSTFRPVCISRRWNVILLGCPPVIYRWSFKKCLHSAGS